MQASQFDQVATLAPGQIISDATVWAGADYPDDRSWVHALEPAMLDEVRDATQVALARGIAPKDITAADFPLKRTGELLREVYSEVESGPGFSLLSGFELESSSEPERTLAYCGLCSHFGGITLQNRAGEYILEVTDKGKGYNQRSRGYHSTAHLDFHNDGTNTVTLLCLQTAGEGGLSMLVSGPAVYNEIVRSRPEFLDVLHRGFHHHRRDQLDPGDAPVTPYRTPVFSFRNGVFHMAYAGPSILYCENEGIEITDYEKAALDYLEKVIERPEMRVNMELHKGDIQFINNFVVLHARTAYRDSPQKVRKLLRLWLDDENSQRLGPGKMDWYLPANSRFTRIGGIETLSR